MDILNELLIVGVIGALIGVGAYDTVKAIIRYLLQRQKDKREKEKELEPIIPIVPFPDEIVDDIGDIVKDTTPIILKPIVGTVKLVGKVLRKAVKLITFWRK